MTKMAVIVHCDAAHVEIDVVFLERCQRLFLAGLGVISRNGHVKGAIKVSSKNRVFLRERHCLRGCPGNKYI